MHNLAYKNGQRAALHDLGLEKAAFLGFGKAPEVTDEARKLYEMGLPETQRGGQWAVQGKDVLYHPPTPGPVPHNVPRDVIERLNKPKPNMLSRVPMRKVVGGGLALGAGGMLAHHLLQDPQVDVQPSLPMRTMFP